MTSWDNYQDAPPVEKLTHTLRPGSLCGWHTLLIQVGGGNVRYFIDGQPQAQNGGPYYPDAFMSVVFNLWFQKGGLLPDATPRSYRQDVDWVFRQRDAVLSPAGCWRGWRNSGLPGSSALGEVGFPRRRKD